MYNKTRNVSEYKTMTPVAYTASTAGINYGSVVSHTSPADDYKSLISESKCRCNGTCRTGMGCTCK